MYYSLLMFILFYLSSHVECVLTFQTKWKICVAAAKWRECSWMKSFSSQEWRQEGEEERGGDISTIFFSCELMSANFSKWHGGKKAEEWKKRLSINIKVCADWNDVWSAVILKLTLMIQHLRFHCWLRNCCLLNCHQHNITQRVKLKRLKYKLFRHEIYALGRLRRNEIKIINLFLYKHNKAKWLEFIISVDCHT